MRILENVKQILFKKFVLLHIIFFSICCFNKVYALGGISKVSNAYIAIEISSDGKKIRAIDECYIWGAFGLCIEKKYGKWVDLKYGGTSLFLEISNEKIKMLGNILYKDNNLSYDERKGDLCKGLGAFTSVLYQNFYHASFSIDINGDSMRLCLTYCYWNCAYLCGDWIKFDKNYVCQNCPSGYTYNSNRNICEANPICTEGTYDPVVKKCYIGDKTCPLGQYECLKLSDGKNYCSNIQCADTSIPSSFGNTDTPQGLNDKQADGQINQNGECTGTIYIFNGKDKRCRLPGTQTYFNNCCNDDTIQLTGLVTLGKCNADEQYLAKLRNWGQRDGKCHYIGKYCAERWKYPGGSVCVQYKRTYCCFNSPLSRIIQEQGRQQLGISWGTPTSPNCRGFTPEEFQKIDWNKIDFSEWIENEVVPNIESNLQNNLQNTINNIRNSIQTKYK